MKHAILILALWLSWSSAAAQFRMIGTATWTTLTDSTYAATVTFQTDLTGMGYLATQITTGYRMITGTEQLYTVSNVGADPTFTSAVLTVKELNGDHGSPVGQVMVFNPNGKESIPQAPFGATGATAQIQAAIDSYNARLIGSGGVVIALDDLTDAVITAPVNNQVLRYNGTNWVNATNAGGGDVTTAQLADSTAAVRADFPTDTDTQLTEEQVEDFVGGMVTGNTETLITVTYDDNGGVLNFVVESNLSNYTNDAGFLTSEVDGSTTNEIQTLSFSSPNISISGGNSVDISAIDTDTQLTDEQVQDIIGAMLSGNTETLITVTYDDNGAVINFVVDNNLSNYDNSTSGFLTAEVDADTTNELISSTSISADTITITDAGSTQTIVTGAVKAVVGVAPSGGTQTINLQSKYVGVHQIDVTSASSPLTLTVNNPVNGGVYTFHVMNATSNDVAFPAAFLNADGTSVGTVSYTSDDFLTCYYDGTNYYCK